MCVCVCMCVFGCVGVNEKFVRITVWNMCVCVC